MNPYKLFPRTVTGASARLLLLGSLSIVIFAVSSLEGFGQNSSGRPVARLITATGVAAPPSTHHRVAVRPVASASVPVLANSLERRAFDLVNAERAKNRLPPLVWDPALCRVARLHSEKMARLNFFEHKGPDGDVRDRVSEGGVRWRSVGENIALNQGYNDPVGLAVDQWMHSSGHRGNILRETFTHSGIGIARAGDGRVYLTQVFIMR